MAEEKTAGQRNGNELLMAGGQRIVDEVGDGERSDDERWGPIGPGHSKPCGAFEHCHRECSMEAGLG